MTLIYVKYSILVDFFIILLILLKHKYIYFYFVISHNSFVMNNIYIFLAVSYLLIKYKNENRHSHAASRRKQ